MMTSVEHRAPVIDQIDTEELFEAFLPPIRLYYLTHKRSNQNVLVVLNALALTTAIILHGADPTARKFFESALDKNIKDNSEKQR